MLAWGLRMSVDVGVGVDGGGRDVAGHHMTEGSGIAAQDRSQGASTRHRGGAAEMPELFAANIRGEFGPPSHRGHVSFRSVARRPADSQARTRTATVCPRLFQRSVMNRRRAVLVGRDQSCLTMRSTTGRAPRYS